MNCVIYIQFADQQIQQGETQHKRVKKNYTWASKAQPTRSIAKIQRREDLLRKMEDKHQAIDLHSNSVGQASGSRQRVKNGPMLRLEDEENLPYTRPEAQYHIAGDTKYRLNIYQWPDDDMANDIAYKVSLIS